MVAARGGPRRQLATRRKLVLRKFLRHNLALCKPWRSGYACAVDNHHDLPADNRRLAGGRYGDDPRQRLRAGAAVSDLCAVCGVPRRTLTLAFQQVLGMGPITYLRRLRLNQARRSLRQPSPKGRPKSVTEIALDNGFWHLGRFSSQFRELFGTCPSDSTQSSRDSG